jgi:two-component system chemotaxis response regulator CheY
MKRTLLQPAHNWRATARTAMTRVLVADDDQAILNLIAQLLKGVGADEVVEVITGSDTLDHLGRDEFDLVVLDRYLPDLDGLDLIRQVRAQGCTVPIVMVTGEARKDQVMAALEAGASEYMIKPFDHDVLREKLGKYCRNPATCAAPTVHRARDVMTTGVVTIEPEATVAQAIEAILRHGVSGLPVVDQFEQLVGIITEFQLLKAIHRPEVKEEAVRGLMTKNVVTVKEETTLAVVAKMMEKHHIRRVPVTRNGKVVGVIARRDLLRYITNNAQAQTELLDTASLSVSA